MVHNSKCKHGSWWLMIALRGSWRSAVAVAGALLLLAGCPEASPNNTNDNSSANENMAENPDSAAEQAVVVTMINVAITPDGAGQVVQTDLGFSRIQLFAIPASSDYVFDGWIGAGTRQNPVTIMAAPGSSLIAEFRSTLPPWEQDVE